MEPWPGGSNWKVSRCPTVLVPAYSLLRQEQFQPAQASFNDRSQPARRKDMPVPTYLVQLLQEWPKLVGLPDLKALALAPATHSLEEEPHPVPAKFSGEPLAITLLVPTRHRGM